MNWRGAAVVVGGPDVVEVSNEASKAVNGAEEFARDIDIIRELEGILGVGVLEAMTTLAEVMAHRPSK